MAIRVSGGGTGEGVEQLLASAADLCAASRPFRPDEVQALNRGFGTLGLRYLIARDALSVYVHPSNPLRSLDLDQIKRLFAGRVARWSELGGADLPVTVVIRPPSSGTHHFFRDHVLADADYAGDAEVAARVGDVIARVAAEPGAVGYGDLAHDGAVVAVRVDGVDATPGTVRSGDYPLARYLYYYAVEPPDGGLRDYLDWCLGPEGQRLVREVGFIALWTSD
jgi:phosphate transport system substrate-binding protein